MQRLLWLPAAGLVTRRCKSIDRTRVHSGRLDNAEGPAAPFVRARPASARPAPRVDANSTNARTEMHGRRTTLREPMTISCPASDIADANPEYSIAFSCRGGTLLGDSGCPAGLTPLDQTRCARTPTCQPVVRHVLTSKRRNPRATNPKILGKVWLSSLRSRK
jgi:hypothetical protein